MALVNETTSTFKFSDIGKILNGAKSSVENTNELITIWQLVGIVGLLSLFYTIKKYLR
jgi:hypothetical protein